MFLINPGTVFFLIKHELGISSSKPTFQGMTAWCCFFPHSLGDKSGLEFTPASEIRLTTNLGMVESL
jgi:hypothetical protein